MEGHQETMPKADYVETSFKFTLSSTHFLPNLSIYIILFMKSFLNLNNNSVIYAGGDNSFLNNFH